jgi:hypothetical protein
MALENTHFNGTTDATGTHKPVVVVSPDAGTSLPAYAAKPVTHLPVTSVYPARDWPGVAHRVLDGMGTGWRVLWKLVKLAVCIGLDVMDFFIGRIPGFGIVYDLACALICAAMWGRNGWWVLLEQIDFTEQIDAFIPTCTLVALASWNNN